MCRAPSSSGSTNTPPSPKAARDSRCADATCRASSSAARTTRIPRPPPPATALTSTGNSHAGAGSASSPSAVSASDGSVGTPASDIRRLAVSLTPIAAMAAGGGPTQVSPASTTARAKAAFSDRNPYPGCTASAPEARQAASSRSTAR
jgi:hypothetical protein